MAKVEMSPGVSGKPTRTKPTIKEHSEAPEPKAVKRCTLCNESGYLELLHEGTNELLVHRCPHQRELITAIEKRLMAYRLS